jgi:hypothetical protein
MNKTEKPAASSPSKDTPSPDSTKKKGDVELNEKQLDGVAGGLKGMTATPPPPPRPH